MIKYIQELHNVVTTIPSEMKLIYYYDDWFDVPLLPGEPERLRGDPGDQPVPAQVPDQAGDPVGRGDDGNVAQADIGKLSYFDRGQFIWQM